MFDMIMKHEDAKRLDNEAMFGVINSIYPDRELYSMSLDWRDNKQYVLKVKGVKGDVLVGWQEVKYSKEWNDAWGH